MGTFRQTSLKTISCILAVLAWSITPTFAEELIQGPKAGEAALHGEALAKANCERCHAVGLEGDSPHPNAPAFWSMSQRRPVETIATMLLDKAGPKHSDMPNFTITHKQAEDLAAWIAWIQPIAHGKRLVSENCGACHAVGIDDESTHKDAPPFRKLSEYYPVEALEEAFAEGIESGHPDMPVFDVDLIDLQDILAYIESIQKS